MTGYAPLISTLHGLIAHVKNGYQMDIPANGRTFYVVFSGGSRATVLLGSVARIREAARRLPGSTRVERELRRQIAKGAHSVRRAIRAARDDGRHLIANHRRLKLDSQRYIDAVGLAETSEAKAQRLEYRLSGGGR